MERGGRPGRSGTDHGRWRRRRVGMRRDPPSVPDTPEERRTDEGARAGVVRCSGPGDRCRGPRRRSRRGVGRGRCGVGERVRRGGRSGLHEGLHALRVPGGDRKRRHGNDRERRRRRRGVLGRGSRVRDDGDEGCHPRRLVRRASDPAGRVHRGRARRSVRCRRRIARCGRHDGDERRGRHRSGRGQTRSDRRRDRRGRDVRDPAGEAARRPRDRVGAPG